MLAWEKHRNSLTVFLTALIPMLLLRRVHHASIGVNREVFDPVNLFLIPVPSSSWVLKFQGTSVLELAK